MIKKFKLFIRVVLLLFCPLPPIINPASAYAALDLPQQATGYLRNKDLIPLTLPSTLIP